MNIGEGRRCSFCVCNKNKCLSLTDEKVVGRRYGINAQSAGKNSSARRVVNLNDIKCADRIFVTENKHASRLHADFRQDPKFKEITNLDIPDDYQFMDPELIRIFEDLIL